MGLNYLQLHEKGDAHEIKIFFDYHIDLSNWYRTRHHTGTGKKEAFSGCLET
jgi:hypothetical protein